MYITLQPFVKYLMMGKLRKNKTCNKSSQSLLSKLVSNFLEIIPGGSPDELESGDTMEFSQDAVDISQLLGKFMFSAAGNNQK